MVADDDAEPADRVGSWDLGTTSLGVPVDTPLRKLYRSAATACARGEPVPPDPVQPDCAEALLSWLTDAAAGARIALTARLEKVARRARATLR